MRLDALRVPSGGVNIFNRLKDADTFLTFIVDCVLDRGMYATKEFIDFLDGRFSNITLGCNVFELPYFPSGENYDKFKNFNGYIYDLYDIINRNEIRVGSMIDIAYEPYVLMGYIKDKEVFSELTTSELLEHCFEMYDVYKNSAFNDANVDLCTCLEKFVEELEKANAMLTLKLEPNFDEVSYEGTLNTYVVYKCLTSLVYENNLKEDLIKVYGDNGKPFTFDEVAKFLEHCCTRASFVLNKVNIHELKENGYIITE